MRLPALPALLLLALPGTPAQADKTFVNRSGSPVGLQLAERAGGLGFVEARVLRAAGAKAEPGTEVHLFPLNPRSRLPLPGPIRLADGDAVEFRILTERKWAPGKAVLALDLFTWNALRPWDPRMFQGEYLRVRYRKHPAIGEELQGVRLAPADGSEEDVCHRFTFLSPGDGKADLELAAPAAGPEWCVIL